MPTARSSPSLRAVANGGNPPLLAVTSLSATPQKLTIACASGARSDTTIISLGAFQTITRWACGDPQAAPDAVTLAAPLADKVGAGNAIGISVTSNGSPGSYAAFAIARHSVENTPLLESVTFSDPETLHSSDLAFPGVPVGELERLPGTFTPELAAANFGNTTARITITYARTEESPVSKPDSAKVREFTLPPGRTLSVRMNELQGSPDLADSLIVSSSAKPGDVVLNLHSVSERPPLDLFVLGHDEKGLDNGGRHPWTFDQPGGSDAELLLFNYSSAPQNFVISIGNGKPLWLGHRTLAPKETTVMSLRDLVAEQTKDDSGKTLPRDLTSGQIDWRGEGANPGKGRLFEFDWDSLVARSFSCGGTYDLCANNVPMQGSGATISVGGSATLTVGMPDACEDFSPPPYNCICPVFLPYGDVSYSWSGCVHTSGCAGGSQSVSLSGQTPGTDTVEAQVQDLFTPCIAVSDGTVDVKPAVSIVGGNAFIFAGTDSTATQFNLEQAQGNPTGGTFTWSATGNSVTFNPNGVSSASITTLTAPTPSKSTNDTTITVKYQASGSSESATATKQITALKFEFLEGPSTSTINFNGPTEFGYDTTATYVIHTFPGEQPMPSGFDGITVTENVSGCSACVTGPGGTNANSNIVDDLHALSSQPLPPAFSITASQTISVGGFLVRNNTLNYTAQGVTITNNGPTQ